MIEQISAFRAQTPDVAMKRQQEQILIIAIKRPLGADMAGT